MDPEISLEEEEEKVPEPVEVKPVKSRRRINWRKVGLGSIFTLATATAFAGGYFGVWAWQYNFPGSFLTGPNPYENWLVYRSETYGLGLRYPDNWEATEVKPSYVVFRQKAQTEGEVLPKDYLNLTVASNAKRGKTACEENKSKCSFYANGIYGDRSSTPNQEVIFFSQDGKDFTLIWNKYGVVDYAVIFEDIGKSLRFTTPEQEDDQLP